MQPYVTVRDTTATVLESLELMTQDEHVARLDLQAQARYLSGESRAAEDALWELDIAAMG